MIALRPESNITLIGMPGVGKSTVGILLAKVTSRDFLDTDVCIQSHEGRQLQEILDADGRESFLRIEENHVLALDVRGHVIATGGSVVYSEAAMRHLRAAGVVVHLDLPCERIEDRIRNMGSRGIVKERGQTVCALYAEREPLYRKHADMTVNCAGLNHEQVVARIVDAIGFR
jgi:shikimate kinase